MAANLIVTAVLMAAQMAMTALRKIEGPRLEDLKFTVADPGAPLNYFWGTKRFAAIPIFFAEDIKEKKHKRKTKGGKYNDYTYFATFAAVIADHPIQAVTRIWLDKHLVYDATGTGPVVPILSDSLIFGGTKSSGLDKARIYLGDDDQEPDPRMLASIEAKLGVVGSCPAYRRIAYIMFEDIPLEKFGNRIPQVSIEAVSNAVVSYPWETITDPNIYTNVAFYGSRLIQAVNDTVTLTDMISHQQILTADLPGSVMNGGIGVTETGEFYALSGSFFSFILWKMGADGGGTLLTTDGDDFVEGCTYAGGMCCVFPYSFLTPRIMYFNGTRIETVSTAFIPTHYFEDEEGLAWAVGDGGSGNIGFYQMPSGPAKLVPTAAGASDVYAMDNGNGQYFVLMDGMTMLVDKESFTLVDSASSPGYNATDVQLAFRNVRPGAKSIWIKYAEVSTQSLDVLRTVSLASWIGAPLLAFLVYEPTNHALLGFPSGSGVNLRLLFLDRVNGNGVTLGLITGEVCERCGIETADVDVAALTDNVEAYSYTQGQGTTILEPLLDLYGAIARPHNFQLQFIKRGGASAGTIDVSEFAVDGSSPRYSVKPVLDTDLPRRISLNFSDLDADQQPNQVDARRPLPCVDGVGEASYDMGTLGLYVDDAYNLLTRYLRGLWNRNEIIENKLTAKRLALEPGDTLTLRLDDELRTATLDKLTIAASDMLKCEWEKDFSQLATLPDLTGAPKDGHEPAVIFVPVPSRAIILDLPLVRDSDNRVNPLMYEGAGPYAPGLWSGAVIYEDDGSGDYPIEFATVDSSLDAKWGKATNVLADASYFVWDRSGSVNVKLNNGTLVSATEAACNANPRLNLAALGDELIQFATATLETDGSYTLSGLKRGRRGTEWATGTHGATDLFVMMDAIRFVEMGAGDIGDAMSFKAATSGLDVEGAIPVALTYQGNSNRPWAPAQFRGTKNYSTGDWTFTWRRRSRVAGDWAPGTPPLGESAENYKLKIYNSVGAVVRTITSVSETATWTAAQQNTDFGGERWSHVPAGVLQVGDLADGFETVTTFAAVAPPSNLVFVGGASGNGASASAITIGLTSLTGGIAAAPAAGDIVIIGWAIPHDPDLDVNVTGYTQLADVYGTGAGADTNLGVFYKVMGGSPDTTAELSATGHAVYQGSYAIQVWRNPNAVPIGVVTSATGTSVTQAIDPPSLTPAQERSVMIFVGANSCSASSEAVPAPTQNTADLDHFIAQGASANPGTNDHAAIGMGSRIWDGVGPYDAPSWDGKGNGFTWAAVSIELRSS